MDKNFNRNPKGSNQWELRSNTELQKIIDEYPHYTKKDLRGEGSQNPKKENALLTRKETERPGLIFHQIGIRTKMDIIIKHSTNESIKEFNQKKINLGILKNRARQKKIRDNMTQAEKNQFYKNQYKKLTPYQIERKNERNREYYWNFSNQKKLIKKERDKVAARNRWANISEKELKIKRERDREFKKNNKKSNEN